MNESGNSERNDIEIIETRLSKIDSRLENIEKQLSKSRRISGLSVVYSSGLAAMVAGMAISNIQNCIAGIITFGVGFILLVGAVMLLRKSFPSRHN